MKILGGILLAFAAFAMLSSHHAGKDGERKMQTYTAIVGLAAGGLGVLLISIN